MPYETRCKTGRTSAKFVPRSRVGIFHNERTRSIPVDPKLMFWCILFYLGALRTVWLRYETRCKTGRTSAKVRATKSLRNFSQRTHPIHPIGPKTNVLVRFVLFGCIRDRLVAVRNSVQNGRTCAKVHATKSRRNFLQRTYPVDPIGRKTDVLVRFVLFGCIWDHLVALRNSAQNRPNECKSS